jgi:hypothetical protein
VYRWSWRILGSWEECVSLELENLGIVGRMCIVGAGESWDSGRDVYCVSLELEDLVIVGGMCIVGAGESWDSGRDVYCWSWRILG